MSIRQKRFGKSVFRQLLPNRLYNSATLKKKHIRIYYLTASHTVIQTNFPFLWADIECGWLWFEDSINIKSKSTYTRLRYTPLFQLKWRIFMLFKCFKIENSKVFWFLKFLLLMSDSEVIILKQLFFYLIYYFYSVIQI